MLREVPSVFVRCARWAVIYGAPEGGKHNCAGCAGLMTARVWVAAGCRAHNKEDAARVITVRVNGVPGGCDAIIVWTPVLLKTPIQRAEFVLRSASTIHLSPVLFQILPSEPIYTPTGSIMNSKL